MRVLTQRLSFYWAIATLGTACSSEPTATRHEALRPIDVPASFDELDVPPDPNFTTEELMSLPVIDADLVEQARIRMNSSGSRAWFGTGSD